jgi:hypothetical protein
MCFFQVGRRPVSGMLRMGVVEAYDVLLVAMLAEIVRSGLAILKAMIAVY